MPLRRSFKRERKEGYGGKIEAGKTAVYKGRGKETDRNSETEI